MVAVEATDPEPTPEGVRGCRLEAEGDSKGGLMIPPPLDADPSFRFLQPTSLTEEAERSSLPVLSAHVSSSGCTGELLSWKVGGVGGGYTGLLPNLES